MLCDHSTLSHLKNVNPKCLCESTSFISTLFIYSGG